jgi:Calcineurin-like phosphoesterase
MFLFEKKNALRTMMIVACLGLVACQPGTRTAELIAVESTDANLKVAFIGDSGYGTDFDAVLTLIKNERADMVLHQGDFDYAHDADGFFAKIDAIMGPNFPYLAAVGNHDIASWNTGCGDPDGCYAQLLKDRMARIGIAPDHPDLNDQMYSVTYRGLKIVFAGQERWAGDTMYAPYIHSQLATEAHVWKICSWHKNQNAMQLGNKGDEMGWGVYETCKNHGAIVATGHEHSYGRTRTLTNMRSLTVDAVQHPPVAGVPGNSNQLLVEPGRSFVFVSGLGGHTMRNQERCTPFTYPYGGGPGCSYIWAKAYTSDQTGGTEKFGALFIIFNYNGDQTKARGYFKTSDGVIIDEFDITAVGASVSPLARRPTAVSYAAP